MYEINDISKLGFAKGFVYRNLTAGELQAMGKHPDGRDKLSFKNLIRGGSTREAGSNRGGSFISALVSAPATLIVLAMCGATSAWVFWVPAVAVLTYFAVITWLITDDYGSTKTEVDRRAITSKYVNTMEARYELLEKLTRSSSAVEAGTLKTMLGKMLSNKTATKPSHELKAVEPASSVPVAPSNAEEILKAMSLPGSSFSPFWCGEDVMSSLEEAHRSIFLIEEVIKSSLKDTSELESTRAFALETFTAMIAVAREIVSLEDANAYNRVLDEIKQSATAISRMADTATKAAGENVENHVISLNMARAVLESQQERMDKDAQRELDRERFTAEGLREITNM